ncbi:MAG TPA: YncE family protein [Puia sp.]
MKKQFLLSILSLSILFVNAQKVVNTFHIPSAGGWDYIAVNQDKIYVSHGTQVNILNKATGDSSGVILNTTGVHGIAFDNTTGKGYTSNGRLNNVTVFDLATNAVLGQIATGTNPDAIMYDPFTKTIITCNGRSNDLSVIDVAKQQVIATIPVGGKPETAVSDNEGKLFVNIEDKNEIAVIDLKTNTVINRWSLAPGEGPSGLAIDLATKRLFSTCDKLLVVMDATNGKIVAKLPIGDGTDGVVFDNATKLIYTSNGEGTITAVKETGNNNFSISSTIPTRKGARTIAIDESTHTLYLPTAEFEANTPKGQRPKMIPGTFQILAVK